MAVQWLELGTVTAEGPGLSPGWGTKIPQVTWCVARNMKIKIPPFFKDFFIVPSVITKSQFFIGS